MYDSDTDLRVRALELAKDATTSRAGHLKSIVPLAKEFYEFLTDTEKEDAPSEIKKDYEG